MRRVFIVAAIAVVILGGCSNRDDKAQAVEKARAACGFRPVAPGQQASVTDATTSRDRYEQSADLAAQAARLDPAWNDLSRAYSTLADAWGFVATLGEPGTPEFLTAAQAQQAQVADWLKRGTDAEGVVRAECRKIS